MKKTLIVVIIFLLCLTTACTKNKEVNKFKDEYESLNGEKSKSGKTIRTLEIPEDNPFVYQTAEEISERIDKEETFVVYFGFASCPWCRSMIEQFIKSAKDNNVDKIYYVDVLEIRDTYEFNDDNELVKTKEGTTGYNELIEKIGNVLSDYTLTSENGEEVEVGEKRIYAPNVVAIVDGEAEKMVEGLSSKLEDPYSELTDEMKEESYNSFKCIWECFKTDAHTCQKNAC